MTLKRYIPSAVLAFGVTCGLGIFMAVMIRAEFTPQEKAETLGFDINPVEPDIPEPPGRKAPALMEKVETPPAPPQIDKGTTEKVKVPPKTLEGNPNVFDPEIILVAGPAMIPIDRNVQPIFRIAPQMPLRAERSGHCKVRFDVTGQGVPMNVKASYCSQSLFLRPTIKSVQKWKFNPRIKDGFPVAMTGLTNIVRFQLQDERGKLIPE